MYSDLLANLNPEQREAVTLPPVHENGQAQSALILAGAGSGKTRVLTTRIAWLIQTGQVSPIGVLAVTFTNKAAKEMMLRLSAMLPINTRGMWIGTFHGLCNRLLRAHHKEAGLPSTFQILDTQDQLSAIKRLLKGLKVDDEKYPAKQLQYFIAHAKERGQRAKDLALGDDFQAKMAQLYAAYDEQCQREGVVDFAELLLRSYELLKHSEAIRTHYQERFRHILIDEFQDTNALQYAWLKLLSGHDASRINVSGMGSSSVFAVGDDDQSIYAFRGADVENMRLYEKQYHPLMVKLEQNYRSHGHILDTANHLIANNSERLGKNLRTDAGHGEPVRIYEAPSDHAEAAWLVDEIKALVNSGIKRTEVALLYRSNAQSRIIEHALFSAGIPYRVYGGLRFFERAEIKHALAYLRLLENPNDDTSFSRVVNFPTRGIGARSIEALQDAARAQQCSLYLAASTLEGKAGAALSGFVRLVDHMREATRHNTLPETVEFVIQHSGLIQHYLSEREGQDRVENLQELINAATAFIAEEGYGQDAAAAMLPGENAPGVVEVSPLAAFLSHASLEAGDNQAQAGQDAVQLMTVHSAKGLEFTSVFITGLEEGLFPHENSVNEQNGLEEERRLMYVAITRAKERLYLSHTQSRMLHGQVRYNMPSRFLEELPSDSLKWLTPKARDARWGGGNSRSGSTWQDGYTRQREYESNDFFDSGSERQRPAKRVGSASMEVKRLASPPRGNYPFTIGQNVFHTKFGEGRVTGLEGVDADARAQVNFKRHGIKWLQLSIAKLAAID
ncbi:MULTISPECIES: UvrD-helicase domain-containing protein [unclassified Polynucleobacter]|jgi:DNA helicase-2/ATP-dependent DNA helicase PcrA|uniref:UvrD-helicase domain-containing protein n=1 Tax=unclassified Polynucleobacter TaxID=2640945 RepID=UPI0009267880|nr:MULTISPECIES: UvrD-helicase domain-containing protein [unclassified Polynucleobacter]MBU3562475.1 UvrD-helicase domain-containing protein [Polynucleobacter sp. Tro8-14-1]MBU3641040.1 UvrD-helicase domain-containing protein [Polynucleobacter sp. Fuers-14]MEA9568509.1 UvrD-helicase domain-containing protein [Polynucleobacter sp. AP-Nickl1-40-C4]OJI05442.1 DNA helicase II [Polynucleobacter sp. MWH-Adler-W8]